MKRLFIFISTFLILGFLAWNIVESPDQLAFATYPFVYVKDDSQGAVKKEVLDQALQEFVTEHHSVVVKRIVKPTKEGHDFVYQQYGIGTLPGNFSKASEENREMSTVFSQYMIVQGELKGSQLADEFLDLGYTSEVIGKTATCAIMSSFLSGAPLLALLIMVLTYTAIVLIFRIKDLRAAGIRLISGESMSWIMVKSIQSEGIIILSALVSSILIGVLIFACLNLLRLRLLLLLFSGLFFYSVLLLMISVFLSVVYTISLRNVDLMSIIKGKLPLRRLLAIILVCQFIGLVIVGWGISRIPLLAHAFQEQQSAIEEWDKQQEWVNLSFNVGQEVGSKEAFDAESQVWYPFLQEELTHQGALLVSNNLLNYINSDVDRRAIDSLIMCLWGIQSMSHPIILHVKISH